MFTQYSRKVNLELIQYSLLAFFTAFIFYFSISSLRMSKLGINDLKVVKGNVESITYKKAKGKQAKPEVLINLQKGGHYRVAYGNNDALLALSSQIKSKETVTVYLRNDQAGFINLGNENDILQIVRDGNVVYSLNIPQKSFHDYYVYSLIVSLLFPAAGILYMVKSRSNAMMESLSTSQLQPAQL